MAQATTNTLSAAKSQLLKQMEGKIQKGVAPVYLPKGNVDWEIEIIPEWLRKDNLFKCIHNSVKRHKPLRNDCHRLSLTAAENEYALFKGRLNASIVFG